MGTDLRHTPVVGADEGYPDLIARPDMTTMTTLPWEPGVASCLANLEPPEGGTPIPDPRAAVRRVVEELRAIGLDPLVGPELEFFLVRRDPAATHGIRRRVDRPSMVYTVGPQADPGGVVREMTEALVAVRAGSPRRQSRVHEQPVRDQPAEHDGFGDAVPTRPPRRCAATTSCTGPRAHAGVHELAPRLSLSTAPPADR
jgi:glutamine synthetase